MGVFEPMGGSPETKCKFEKKNSIGNVLNTSTDLNRASSTYKALVKMPFLGVFFEPMDGSPGTKWKFETKNSVGKLLNTSKDLNIPSSMYKALVKMPFFGVF
jgi:hypothetical protein